MRIALLIGMILLFYSSSAQKSIYDIKIDSLTGKNKIELNQFQNKKILIITTASADSNRVQLRDIIYLKNKFKDSLVILVIPTNSFGTENKQETEMNRYYSSNCLGCIVTSPMEIKESNGWNKLIKWIAKKSDNKMIDIELKNPYQKFLIDSKGGLVGVFSYRIRPNSDIIANAISQCQ